VYTGKIVFDDDNGNRKQFHRCTHEFKRTRTDHPRNVLYGLQYSARMEHNSARTRRVLLHIDNTRTHNVLTCTRRRYSYTECTDYR
jgi:hypothetical protein